MSSSQVRLRATDIPRYTAIRIALRRLMAFALPVSLPLCLWTLSPTRPPARLRYYSWHKWLSITLPGCAALLQRSKRSRARATASQSERQPLRRSDYGIGEGHWTDPALIANAALIHFHLVALADTPPRAPR